VKNPVGYNLPTTDFPRARRTDERDVHPSADRRELRGGGRDRSPGPREASRLLDFVSEVGELSKEVLKATNYGRTSFRPPDGWTGELGDVFFSLICLANSTGVDLEAALDGALGKYRERLARRSGIGTLRW
jgi:NTP pyrophosphatase (non-canonical NTP hydrolase)